MIFVCANCGYKDEYNNLPPAKDIEKRHDPGDAYKRCRVPAVRGLVFPG